MQTPIKRVDRTLMRKNVGRLMNGPLRYEAEKLRIDMDLTGFSYSNFNRVGIINFWSLLKCMELVHKVISRINMKINSKDPTVTEVISSQVIDVDPKLYEDAAISLPCTLSLRPAHVDNKSYSFYLDLINQTNGFRYVHIQKSMNFLDNKIKKGVPLSEEIRQYYETIKGPSAEPIFINRHKAPDNAYKFHLKVAHSDTDSLYHSNQTSYFRYCLDAAATACNEEKLSNFHGDFFRYKVSRGEIVYRRESLPGDDLEVILWEDQHSKDTLHFTIRVKNIVVTIVNIVFFKDTHGPKARL